MKLLLIFFSFSAIAQYKICIKAQRNNDAVCVEKETKNELISWYESNAFKGDFGKNRHQEEFLEGEQVKSGFNSCEDLEREIELSEKSGVIDRALNFVSPKVQKFKRCTYPYKYWIIDSKGKKVMPDELDYNNPSHIIDISSEVQDRKNKKLLKKQLRKKIQKQDLTLQELNELLR